MHWNDQGYIVHRHTYGEGLILSLFTATNGVRHGWHQPRYKQEPLCQNGALWKLKSPYLDSLPR